MAFSQAYKKAIVQKNLDIKLEDKPTRRQETVQVEPQQVPMMYRAQVEGRCSLQYGKNKQDLERWTEEWVYPNPDPEKKKQPFYQYQEPALGLDGAVYRFKIKFPWRVFSNCGQDSILRPVIGKNGIPFIPGSGLKGLFKRLLNNSDITRENKDQIKKYCGTQDEPGTLKFLRAYPVGDWSSTKQVTLKDDTEETRYQMVDICHPQQVRQVEGGGSPKALALISLYRPTLIFELSSNIPLDETEWKNIETLFKEALNQGIGGKTSTGYGLYNFPKNKHSYPLAFRLQGKGVSPLLRNDEPEFRRNLFKATLRGHCCRLLAGVTNNRDQVKTQVNQLFGDTNPGSLQLYWETIPSFLQFGTFGTEKTPIYKNEGILYLDVLSNNEEKDIAFLQKVMEFAFIMGGFGKSWRRVYHPDFHRNYRTRAIGCHWKGEWQKSQEDSFIIQNTDDLGKFLNDLFTHCQTYLGIQSPQPIIDWRESWHPSRVQVYSKVVSQSEAIYLFHDDKFKTTPAIGGRNPNDNRPNFISSVWHRMLPIENNQYLEIITVFKNNANETDWQRQGQDQHSKFIDALTQKGQGLTLTWGH